MEDLLDPSEASVDNLVPQFKSVSCPDCRVTASTLFQTINKSSPAVSTQQGGSNDTSPDVPTIDALVVCHGGFEANGVGTTSGARLQPVLNTEKELPNTSLQNSPKPENQALSMRTSQTPSKLLSCSLLSSLFDQSVYKPPTLSIEEHIRQCKAMTARVKRAGQLNNLRSICPVNLSGTL